MNSQIISFAFSLLLVGLLSSVESRAHHVEVDNLSPSVNRMSFANPNIRIVSAHDVSLGVRGGEKQRPARIVNIDRQEKARKDQKPNGVSSSRYPKVPLVIIKSPNDIFERKELKNGQASREVTPTMEEPLSFDVNIPPPIPMQDADRRYDIEKAIIHDDEPFPSPPLSLDFPPPPPAEMITELNAFQENNEEIEPKQESLTSPSNNMEIIETPHENFTAHATSQIGIDQIADVIVTSTINEAVCSYAKVLVCQQKEATDALDRACERDDFPLSPSENLSESLSQRVSAVSSNSNESNLLKEKEKFGKNNSPLSLSPQKCSPHKDSNTNKVQHEQFQSSINRIENDVKVNTPAKDKNLTMTVVEQQDSENDKQESPKEAAYPEVARNEHNNEFATANPMIASIETHTTSDHDNGSDVQKNKPAKNKTEKKRKSCCVVL